MHLEPRDLDIVADILRRNVPVGVSVSVFGSRAHGRRLKPFSDLDICLKGTEPLPDGVLATLRQAFVDSDLPIKVDVVDWHGLAVDFQKVIADDLVPFTKSTVAPSCGATPA